MALFRGENGCKWLGYGKERIGFTSGILGNFLVWKIGFGVWMDVLCQSESKKKKLKM